MFHGQRQESICKLPFVVFKVENELLGVEPNNLNSQSPVPAYVPILKLTPSQVNSSSDAILEVLFQKASL